jgi:tripartite-type tricarboxylate transporter receptor subunit TctC
LPEVPSLFELGFKEASVDPWIGILAPAGTPREIVGRLNHEIGTVLQQPDVRERLVRLGMEPQESTPEGFAVDIREAVARWPAIVKAAGIRRE